MERRYLDPLEAESVYGIPYKTLERWRREGKGPSYHKVGKSIKYKVAVFDAWMDSQQVSTHDEAPVYYEAQQL